MTKNNRSKRIKLLLLLIYLGFIGYFGFIAKIAGRTQVHTNAYNLIPFHSIRSYFMITDFSALFGFIINILGNIIVFMPVGFFIPWLFSNKAWSHRIISVLLIGFIFSLGVESTQFIMSVGVFDIDDLILNTLGAFIGWQLYRTVRNMPDRY